MTRALLTAAFVLSAAAAGAADSTKTVVIVAAEGAGVDDRSIIDNLQSTVRNRWPSRVRYHVEMMDPVRVSDEAYRQELAEYLHVTHGGRADLLVVLSKPALQFVLSIRQLFPDVPILFAGTGWSRDELQQQGLTGVVVTPEPGRTFAIARELHGDMKHVVLVGGSGAIDQESLRQAREEVQSVAAGIALTVLTDLPISEMIDRVGALPPGHVVFYTLITRDSTGAVFEPNESLQMIRAATEAPIYGCSRSYLGEGLVGGVLVDHAAIGNELGEFASRILAGEDPGSIHPVASENTTAFDWRELRRLGIGEARLPAGAIVDFGEAPAGQPSPRRFPYLAAFGVVVAAGGVGLAVRYRGRRRTQRARDEQRRLERMLTEVSTALITAPPGEVDTAIHVALHRVLEIAAADLVVIYEAPASSDAPWQARYREVRHGVGIEALPDEWDPEREPGFISRLRAGQVVPLLDGERDQLSVLMPGVVSPGAAVAVPLGGGPAMLGVLWCIWTVGTPSSVPRGIPGERFRLVGQMLAQVLQRRRLEVRVQETCSLNAAILSSLPLHVAVLDRTGTIIEVNDAWLDFARRNNVASESAVSPGVSYFEAVERGVADGAPLAQEALDGIRDVCEGRRQLFTLEYECSSPADERWFLMTAAVLRRKGGGAVITHRDITDARRIERTIHESESRFRLLADALPVGVWMSDAAGRRTYFNRAWVDVTGHDLGYQVGGAWIYHLHPDDGHRYLKTYRAALSKREPFSMEFRVRRPDGGYAWMIEHAVPRYGADETFHGFIGSCLDVTERRETEDALRDVTGRVINAEEEDRRRIARDLHDGVNQLVALLAIDIETLGQTPIDTQAELSARVQALWKRTAEISSELHRLSHALHPSRLETFGLVRAIEHFCNELTDQQKIRVALVHHDVPPAIPPETALCLFRIVQEALRNVVKHSGAREATVELSGVPSGLVLRVADAGRGFETSVKQAGLGLVSMRERVRYARGELTIVSAPGEGTRIEVHLPLRTTADTPAPNAVVR